MRAHERFGRTSFVCAIFGSAKAVTHQYSSTHSSTMAGDEEPPWPKVVVTVEEEGAPFMQGSRL